MGNIGSFGSVITFEVNSEKILSPSNIKKTVSGMWNNYKILSRKPKLEFMGPDSDTVALTIILSAEHGVKPRQTIRDIEKAISNGTIAYLSIGGKICGNKMCIQSMSEEWNQVYSNGELVKATLNLTFEEYT